MIALKTQIKQYLDANPQAITLEMAAHFNQPEGTIITALPEEFVRLFPSERAEEIMAELSQWGMLTTIIEKEGSIFEVKDHFPSGLIGRGYYNLNMKGSEGSLHGHIKLDNIAQIAFVNLPFRGKESYNVAFIAENGNTIFKVYLGRDKHHQLYPTQIEKFKTFN